ncbi:MAG: type II toxin-antitoxin system HicA family toxin [bacterium]|nr:type II toxin-antitoxin system HicA family toxin [bacterium]
MPKLKSIKPRELIRVLHKLGFFEHRQRGTSHLVMKHADGRRTTIPMHSGKDIPIGTLRAILRDIQIKPDKLIELLKK